jgi:hypothetical protein
MIWQYNLQAVRCHREPSLLNPSSDEELGKMQTLCKLQLLIVSSNL